MFTFHVENHTVLIVIRYLPYGNNDESLSLICYGCQIIKMMHLVVKSVLLEHDQKVFLNVLLEVDQKEPVAGRTKERKHGG